MLLKSVKYKTIIANIRSLLFYSAGIGRTGCFIAASIGIQQLREEHMVDVLATVCAMRTDR